MEEMYSTGQGKTGVELLCPPSVPPSLKSPRDNIEALKPIPFALWRLSFTEGMIDCIICPLVID